MILVLIDHDLGELDPLSLRAITAARKLTDDVQAVAIGEAGANLASAVGEYGAPILHVAMHEALTDYTPAASGRALAQLVGRLKPEAVFAAGSPRGNEQLAHLATILDLPMAAECSVIALSKSAGTPHSVTRARWAANLLEEAFVHSDLLIATVLAFSVEAQAVPGTGPATVENFEAKLEPSDLLVRVLSRGGESSKGGVTLTPEAEVSVDPMASPNLKNLRRCSGAPSVARELLQVQVGALMPSKSDRLEPRLPPIYTLPQASAALCSTSQGARTAKLLSLSIQIQRHRLWRTQITQSSVTFTKSSPCSPRLSEK
jgi:hypothetical protein